MASDTPTKVELLQHISELQDMLSVAQSQLTKYADGVRCPNCDKLRLEIGAAQSQIAALKMQKPVAFMVESSFNGEEIERHLHEDYEGARADKSANGGVITPLYALPASITGDKKAQEPA